jgi:CMP-N,N'-diacetyllegionaminic acid synthase
MYKGKKILGVITARGGSQSIPEKNIKKLAGEPLIAYTIKAAKNSKLLDYFLVSTDSKKIATVSKKYGAPIPFMRPAELATNTTRSIPVLIHALKWLKHNKNESYDYVMILQPTSPFRTSKDIDVCIKLAVDNNADSVMSMVRTPDFHPAKLKKIEANLIVSLLEKEKGQSAMKHELQEVYRRNCAIYLTKTEFIMKNDLFGKFSVPYVMPMERSIDINDKFEFIVADLIMKEFKKKNSNYQSWLKKIKT